VPPDAPVVRDGAVPPDDPAVMPMERLEARICSLAGHLTAATCQFLLLVAGFDAREGWAGWQMPSCAAWLSWKCQIAPGTAREQVRVARALEELPLTRAEFRAARLSYAKVRALTRIATPDTYQVIIHAGAEAVTEEQAPREDQNVSAETRLQLLHARGNPDPGRPRAPAKQRRHRELPRRRHHPRHDHPAPLRRATRPQHGHLGLPHQRQNQSRPARTRSRSRSVEPAQPGPEQNTGLPPVLTYGAAGPGALLGSLFTGGPAGRRAACKRT
jgi:hypothetical protein